MFDSIKKSLSSTLRKTPPPRLVHDLNLGSTTCEREGETTPRDDSSSCPAILGGMFTAQS